jgi:hypothetical protein
MNEETPAGANGEGFGNHPADDHRSFTAIYAEPQPEEAAKPPEDAGYWAAVEAYSVDLHPCQQIDEVPWPSRIAGLADLPLPVELYSEIKPALINRHLTKGLLLAGSMFTIFGHEGSAKSFLLYALFLHIAAGRPWFGRSVRQGPTVIIAAEGQAGVRLRIEAFKRETGITDLPFAIIPTSVDLLDPNVDLAKLRNVLDFLSALWDSPPVALGIDTLAQTIGGGDENGPDMATYISNCMKLAEPYGCAIGIVHHQPLEAQTKRPRGHSSYAASMDTMLHVEGRQNPRTVTIVKQKDIEPGAPFLFELKPVEIGEDEEGAIVTSCVVQEIEGEAPRARGRKLSPTNQTALDALDRVTIRQGFAPPTTLRSDLISPLTGKVAELSAWQEEAVAAFSDPDKDADTPARTFRRARKELQASKIIGVHGTYVWRNYPSRTGAGQ